MIKVYLILQVFLMSEMHGLEPDAQPYETVIQKDSPAKCAKAADQALKEIAPHLAELGYFRVIVACSIGAGFPT